MEFNKLMDVFTAVIGRKYTTPRRAAAAASLASHQKSSPSVLENYRPGLSANISGTAFMDQASVSSAYSMSSLPCTAEAINTVHAAQKQGARRME